MKKKISFIVGTSFLVIATFVAGVYFGKTQVNCRVCPAEDVNFSLFWETYSSLKEKYADPEKIKENEILYGAISGMVESLDDPYTVFMKPDDSERFKDDISGEFEGVGMEVGVRDKTLQVIAPLEGTPADKAGLRSGDIIASIDGETTNDVTIDEAVGMIRGEKGTVVVLGIIREGWDSLRDISVKRGVIKVPSVKTVRYNLDGEEDENGKIAYFKIYHFSQKVGFDFLKAATKVYLSNADRIVIDLRNNPGGYLQMARNIAGYFLPKGDIVVVEQEGEQRTELKAQGEGFFVDYPVVVLINEGSASASEILAGALRDNREVQLIGKTSFGKGTVQELTSLSSGSSLKVTVAKWLTPDGNVIHEVGLDPDIEVELTEEDYKTGRDPQLEKALQVLINSK